MTAGEGAGRPPTFFIIAGEESGDLLGANLMATLIDRLGGRARFLGVGGARMARLGLASMFPMEEISLHGLLAAARHSPLLLRRIRETADAVVAAGPDVLVLIDVPGFNLRVGRRVRRRRQDIPIVDYVSPSVWAYMPGRARRMARYVDRLLAILPFEPEVHRRLGGPPTTYVGHPLLERVGRLRPAAGERPAFGNGPPRLVVLPGSRRSEISRLMPVFAETVAETARRVGPLDVVLPAVPRFAAEIRERVAAWPVRPKIVEGEAATYAAFRRSHAALAASGTVTLELALSGVPTVVAYRVDPLVRLLKPFLLSGTIVLPNLILGNNAVPEFLDGDATPERLAGALAPLLADTPPRAAQLAEFARLDRLMTLDEGTPSSRAADVVLAAMRQPGAIAARPEGQAT